MVKSPGAGRPKTPTRIRKHVLLEKKNITGVKKLAEAERRSFTDQLNVMLEKSLSGVV